MGEPYVDQAVQAVEVTLDKTEQEALGSNSEERKASHSSGQLTTTNDTTATNDSSSVYEELKQFSEAEFHGEYEAQYFGFTADVVTDSLYNAVVQHMFEALSSFRSIMQSKFPDQVSDERSEKIGTKLMTRFQKRANKAFDKLAVFLKTNIIKVPGNVVLEEDAIQIECRYTTEEETTLDKEIENLHDAISNSKFMNAQLQQEIMDNIQLVEEMDQMVHYISTAEDAFLQAGVTNMKTTFETTKSKLRLLSGIFESVQPMSATGNKVSNFTSGGTWS